jgi:hypothetical protein
MTWFWFPGGSKIRAPDPMRLSGLRGWVHWVVWLGRKGGLPVWIWPWNLRQRWLTISKVERERKRSDGRSSRLGPRRGATDNLAWEVVGVGHQSGFGHGFVARDGLRSARDREDQREELEVGFSERSDRCSCLRGRGVECRMRDGNFFTKSNKHKNIYGWGGGRVILRSNQDIFRLNTFLGKAKHLKMWKYSPKIILRQNKQTLSFVIYITKLLLNMNIIKIACKDKFLETLLWSCASRFTGTKK